MIYRRGGGIGSEDIRKVAYFEQSVDPLILKVRFVFLARNPKLL